MVPVRHIMDPESDTGCPVNYLFCFINVLHMDAETRTFWISVIAGVIVMLAFAVVSVNVLDLIPIINPFVGGLAAGLIVGRGAFYGSRAGTVSGIAGGVIVFLDYLLGTEFLESVTIPLATLAGSVLILVLIPYFAILGLIGGAMGGMVRH